MTSKTFAPGTVIDSPWLNDVNTATYATLTVSGTNTLTATGPSSMTSYAVGQRFFFLPAANNTSNVTININGLGARAITKLGNILLVAQDLLIGTMAEIVYDGLGFQLLDPQTVNLTQIIPVTNGGTGATTAAQALINLGASGRLLAVQVFPASGTYTPTAGTTTVIVEAVGGGGAGGGANATPAGQVSAGCGGGSGAHTLGRFVNTVPQTITVGAGGVGVLAGNGGNGGQSSFGALLTAPGGFGGDRLVAAPAILGGGGIGANAGTGGNLYNTPGTPGGWVLAYQPTCLGSNGAAGPFGGGAGVSAASDGKNGVGYGAGGGGAGNNPSDANLRTGGNGASGVVIVYEYA